MRDIGKNLKGLREQKGLKQEELADQLYVTRQTISNYENGRSRPDIETLMKLAELLGTDINSILYGPPVPVNRKDAKCRFIVAGTLTLIFFLLWVLGDYFFGDHNILTDGTFNPDIWWLSIFFFRPTFFLMLGWSFLGGIALLCNVKPLQQAWVKYARWAVVSVTGSCLACIAPYVFNWVISLIPFFDNIITDFIDFPIVRHFSIEILELNGNFYSLYFLLGALLWLFGFPQKKEKTVE